MTKEEKIKEAYKDELLKDSINEKASLEFLENLLPHIKENGWIDSENCEGHYGYLMESELEIKYPLLRLKSLSGIEDNNGWIKIESEDNLPEPENTVIWLRNEGEPPFFASMLDSDFLGIDYFTHWRPNDFKPPLH